MDPFEEFEFKPLSDGLGFQKKNPVKAKSAAKLGDMVEKAVERSKVEVSRASADLPVNWGEDNSTPPSMSKRPTHSKNISDIISSLPSLDLFEERNKSDESGEILMNESRGGTAAKMNVRRSDGPARLEKPFGGQLSGSKASAITSPQRANYSAPRPGSPTVPGVAAIAEMAAAASADILGSDSPAAMKSKPTTKPMMTSGMATPQPQIRATASAPQAAIVASTSAMTTGRPSNVTATLEQDVSVSWEKSSGNLVAILLDAIMVTGFALLFLVALLVVTKINLSVLMNNFRTDLTTQFAAGLLLFSVQQVYMIISRSFYGCTLGEWAFDLQLGTPEQQRKAYYPILVTWRSFVVLLFGGLVIPLLSFLAGRDLAYYLCGLNLYRVDTSN